MYFEVQRKVLLGPLKMVTSVVEQRQTSPILSNLLVVVEAEQLRLTGTDAEVEITCTIPLEASLGADHLGQTTLPARKFYDIVRALPEDECIQVTETDQKVIVKAGRSRFSLACLPAEDFPGSLPVATGLHFELPQRAFKDLLAYTDFAMATADVRAYLNGLLFDLTPTALTVVATDGHRLAFATEPSEILKDQTPLQVIIPRKTVKELSRLLDNSDAAVAISVDNHHIKVKVSEALTIHSKLIDGKFPDYQSVISLSLDKIVLAETGALKAALSQSAILSNEKYRGVRLTLTPGKLLVSSRNPIQEESEIECAVDYQGDAFEAGFNVNYLQDVLSVVGTKEVQLSFSDANSSCLLQPKGIDTVKHVVMPMRL